jgi:DNA mismatch repair protein MutL
MPHIRQLPPHIISKIAAGEVIERPASVIKELLENALDANASNITIRLENYGLKKIEVNDDGCGMPEEDLLKCFKPHTTSKLPADDLFAVNTLGFRGEALSSITAVSRLTIQSRTAAEQTGNLITVENREITEKNTVGMAIGTQLKVESLFLNTPVRKKFLSSPRTELQQIVQLVEKIALSQPRVGFKLLHKNKKIIDLPAFQSVHSRIRALFGTKFSDKLLPVKNISEELNLSGCIGTPELAARFKKRQYFFINNRWFRDHQISAAIKETFASLLEPQAHPAAILFFYLPADQIDINSHPRKEEIKFLKKKMLLQKIKSALQETLCAHDLTFRPLQTAPAPYFTYLPGHQAYDHAAALLRDTATLWTPQQKQPQDEILQLHNTYLLCQTTRGMLLIDQHAAHERILYETLLERSRRQLEEKNLLHLQPPKIFELPLAEANFLQNNLEKLFLLGFDIIPFGQYSFKVSTVPDLLKHHPPELLITDILHQLFQNKKPDLSGLLHRIISLIACRSAIKSGDTLSSEERKALVEKLIDIPGGYTCPHGRPAQIEISLSDLERMFRRK